LEEKKLQEAENQAKELAKMKEEQKRYLQQRRLERQKEEEVCFGVAWRFFFW
jgi:hypothetical protein